jgi:hypothetical protein
MVTASKKRQIPSSGNIVRMVLDPHLGVRRPLGVVLEEFLQPLAASLGHDARVPPPAWGAGSGLDEGDGLRVLGQGFGARLDLIAAVTAWFLALHGLALPSLRDRVTSWSMSIAERSYGIPGAWHGRMVYTEAIPCPDPRQESSGAGQEHAWLMVDARGVMGQ